MVVRGTSKCFSCEKEFNWVVKIKDHSVEEFVNKMDEERGIPIFTGKNKIEVDVNCPSCRNVNRIKKSLK